MFTIIDPRKPLPEAVNVQFDSGEICRVLVSSPWMPPICSLCKGIGHSVRRCKLAPITCKTCNSTTHGPQNCPKANLEGGKKRRTRRAKSKEKHKELQGGITTTTPVLPSEQSSLPKLGTASDFEIGETSKADGPSTEQRSSLVIGSSTLTPPSPPLKGVAPLVQKPASEVSSAADPDSSDIESSSDEEEGEILEMKKDFTLARKKHFSGLKSTRGKGPKHP